MAGNPAFRQSPAFTDNARLAAQAPVAPQPQFGAQQYGAPQFGQQAPYGQAPYGQAPQGQAPYGQAPYGQQHIPTPEQLEQQFGMPPAGPAETGRVSYDGVIMKTVLTLGVVAVGFVVGMIASFTPLASVSLFGGMIVGLVLGLVNVFKRKPSPALILAYALAQGLFLGTLSALFEWGSMNLNGIIFQALLATASVFGVTLTLYAFRIVRTSPRLTKIFMFAIGGYMLYSLINLVLMWTGVLPDAWGMNSVEVIPGLPLGVIMGGLAVLLGAYSLVMDFEGIENGVKRGAPKQFEWTAAFGLTMTIIWLYVEILRILAILRGNN